LALGYLGQADDLSDDLKTLETSKRERKEIEKFVFNKSL